MKNLFEIVLFIVIVIVLLFVGIFFAGVWISIYLIVKGIALALFIAAIVYLFIILKRNR